ncbi:MAG: hypothetical protein IPK77_13020 [Cellvibrio sp.]|nr:hypothetical protein [Cellvibrio sp.]
MDTVKIAPVYRMKVVPHRPLRSFLLGLLVFVLFVLALAAVHFYTIYHERKTLLSPEQTAELRNQLEELTTANLAFQEQLTHYQVTTDVDHQAAESVRKQVLQQQEKIGELERSIAVYRMMLSKDFRNPKGISFGTFSVNPNEQENSFRVKLAIQKLSESEGDFEGELRWILVGREAEKEKKYSLHQLVVVKENDPAFTEIIPLNFKIFQNIEVDVNLPQGFEPTRIELQVTSPRRDATRVESQVEWPRASTPATITSPNT